MTKKDLIARLKKAGAKFDANSNYETLMKVYTAPRTLVKPTPVPLVLANAMESPVTPEKKKYVTNCLVKDPGIPCKHCGHLYDHKTTNTYPNENRRVICGNKSCGLPFIIFRSV